MALHITDESLKPTRTAHFGTWDWRTRTLLDDGFNIPDLVDHNAVAAIGETFETSSLAEQGWEYAHPQGRLDTRRAWRFPALGDTDVFKYRHSPSPSTVRVVVLVDASGSMSGGTPNVPVAGRDEPMTLTKAEASAILAGTLVMGLDPIPTVNIEVLQHDFGYTGADGERARGRTSSRIHTVNIRRAWEEGTPVEFMNQMPTWSPGGGNADGHALMMVGEYLKENLLPGERPMIIIVSDGAPADVGKDPDWGAIAAKHSGMAGGYDLAGAAIREAVANLRVDGVEVISVAIDGGDQARYYGEERCVAFTGDWIALANDLTAKVAERVAAGAEAEEPDAFEL